MSTDANKALIRRFYEEVWDRGNTGFAYEVFADDYVVGRWTATGTHLGQWGGLAPTGRTATFSAANIFRFDNGKVVEIWNHRDDFGLFEQIGSPIHAGSAPDA